MTTIQPYVRSAFNEAQPPPASTTGVIGWMRTNLFSSIGNTVLTILGILFLAWIIPPLVRFLFLDAVWSGSNGEACQAAKVGHEVGACWAFVKAKLNYYTYGSYPEFERWRVDLVFLGGVVGMAWLLWPRIGAKVWGALYFFVIFPIVAFWLLRGGLGLAYVPTNLWGGILVTLVIAVIGIVASLPLGIILALGRRSKMPIAKSLSIVFIEFIRGVPLITILFMANLMLPRFLPEGWNPDPLLRVLVGVALFSAAYMAEVVRGGLQAMPKGQTEGAQALGLTYVQMMILVILPQALKLVIPGIVNSFISLFKDTTLVSIVSIFDFLLTVQTSASDTNWISERTLTSGFIFAAIVYWVFCFGMSRYSQWMERRLDTGHKR